MLRQMSGPLLELDYTGCAVRNGSSADEYLDDTNSDSGTWL